jgi:hypothetical protein
VNNARINALIRSAAGRGTTVEQAEQPEGDLGGGRGGSVRMLPGTRQDQDVNGRIRRAALLARTLTLPNGVDPFGIDPFA